MRVINLFTLPLEEYWNCDESTDGLAVLLDNVRYCAEDAMLFRQTLNALRKYDYLTDVYVLGKQCLMKAHKMILHIASYNLRYFHRSSDGFYVSDLKELDNKSLNALLDFLYTGQISLKGLCIGHIKKLIQVDEELQFSFFRRALLSSIASHLCLANFERFWRLSEETNFYQLTDAVISFLQLQFEYVGTTREFLSLPLQRVRELHRLSMTHPKIHFVLKPYLHYHRLKYVDLLENCQAPKVPLKCEEKMRRTKPECCITNKNAVRSDRQASRQLHEHRGTRRSHRNRDKIQHHPSIVATRTNIFPLYADETNHYMPAKERVVQQTVSHSMSSPVASALPKISKSTPRTTQHTISNLNNTTDRRDKNAVKLKHELLNLSNYNTSPARPPGDTTTTTFISFPTNETNRLPSTDEIKHQKSQHFSNSTAWILPNVSKQKINLSRPRTFASPQIPQIMLLVIVGGPRHGKLHTLCLNLKNLKWMEPEEVDLPYQKSAAFVYGNRCLFMIGGEHFDRTESTCYCWDMNFHQRTQLCPLIVRRSKPQLATVGKVLYAVGGSGWYSSRLSQTEYHIRTEGSWHLASPMKYTRDETASIAVSSAGDKLYIIGGGTNKCEEFCTKSKQWHDLPPLPEDLSLFQSKLMLGIADDTLIAFRDYRPTKVLLLSLNSDRSWRSRYTQGPLPGVVQCCTSWNDNVFVLCKKGAIHNYSLRRNAWLYVKQVPKSWTEMLYIGVVTPD